MSPRGRLPCRLVAPLSIGIAATVLSALLCISSAKVGRFDAAVAAPVQYQVLPAWVPAEWPTPTRTQLWTGTSAGYSHIEVLSEHGGESYSVDIDSFGWPVRAVARWTAGVNLGTAPDRRQRTWTILNAFDANAGARAGVRPPSWLDLNRSLGGRYPVWPVWNGIALNLLLYTSLAALILNGPGFVRRALRRRRGRCIQCGYERAGLAPEDPCPECGRVTSGTGAVPG